MFKDAKAIANKLVDSATGPLNTFDQTVSDNPDLIMPLAALHASIVALSIAGAVAVIRGHQEVRIAKEQTKQIRMKAMLEFHGKHHLGCRHGHHGKPDFAGHHQHGPRFLAQHDAEAK